MSPPAPHPNAAWAAAAVDELVRNGVNHFCLAPGSRCTPLVEAVAGHPGAEAVSHFDERGVGFFALGLARAAGEPVAVVTTSGTAVANLLPAVIEAAQDRVPLVLLTADRPPELRATDANQTMVQPGLFGPYVRWTADVPCPSSEIPTPYLLTTIDQACYRARRAPAGPVHLNFMFREPLSAPGPVSSQREGEGPYTTYTPPPAAPSAESMQRVAEAVAAATHGVVVAGGLARPGDARAAHQLAATLGWPLLPDITSGLRLAAEPEPGIAHYDFLHGLLARADTLLHLGGRLVSKCLDDLRPARYLQVADHPCRHDPHHQVTLRVEASVRLFCEQWMEGKKSAPPSAWLTSWREADQRIAEYLHTWCEDADRLSEPWVARRVAATIPDGGGLFIASSMPVRDINRYAAVRSGTVRVAANRGVSGIDGTVASAAGFARGLQAPVTLLTGDLALLHDLNSLALVRTGAHPVKVVVLNNNGGGIFHFLPVAERTDVFEPYFGTPHGLEFADAARLFGLGYHRVAAPADFDAATAEAGPAIIEVVTDRSENRALHQRLDDALHSLNV